MAGVMKNVVASVKGFLGKKLIVKEFHNNPELAKARYNVCKANAGKCYDAENDTCKICTCICAVKTESKVSINVFDMPPHYEETHCPKGIWPVMNEDGEIGGTDKDIANYWRKFNKKKGLV